MGKRKRDTAEKERLPPLTLKHVVKDPNASMLDSKRLQQGGSTTIQIIVGSYDRVLHGITATIPEATENGGGFSPEVHFADTFLFNAHTSAIRCLAISPLPSLEDPSQSHKLTLASGGTDERINLYHISAMAPSVDVKKAVSRPTLGNTLVTENPKNRELGSLLHHSSSITALYFPTRSKLLSAAEDNTVAISRTRDWTVLSTIKAPIPKAIGRPSGDTAPLGGTPAGVNDFAVHPSMKLMISVGKGEKCMRLWNLVTGKKAGVLTFEREILQGVGEGRWASGEGRKVEWNSNGDGFVVGFEKGAVVFGMDSKPKCRVMPVPVTKIHQIHYIPNQQYDAHLADLLAVSTEDGRVVFYSTGVVQDADDKIMVPTSPIPTCVPLGQLGGKDTDISIRVKDFEYLAPGTAQRNQTSGTIITASSDGSIRIWSVRASELVEKRKTTNGTSDHPQLEERTMNGEQTHVEDLSKAPIRQCGTLLGTHETGNRITCLKAFTMLSLSTPQVDVADNKDSDVFEGISDSDKENNI
ncbi:hypothetical protein MMC26_001346 [Xylographa opegraphella]|nr:hypothetical protein [Xylographa opegraphella]